MITYQYTKDHEPLLSCSECGADLTLNDSVLVQVSLLHRLEYFTTSLDTSGVLYDVDDLVANGYHSETYCSHCEYSLARYESPA